jgi:alpha-1,3-mannosyltransferase
MHLEWLTDFWKVWQTLKTSVVPDASLLLPAGLPVRASCCWNGLTILAAEPFRRGVRVRSHVEASSSSSSECRASECSLLCEDFARLGFDRVVVDAGVQVAYDWGLAREMMSGELLIGMILFVCV